MSAPRSHRIAFGLAFLRGAILVAFSLGLVFAPEDMMPGTSADPARTLGLMFALRTIVLGAALIVLAARRIAVPLAWLFFADASMMAVETVMAVAKSDMGLAVGGIVIGALEAWAGRTLLRAVD